MPFFFWLPMIVLSGMFEVAHAETAKAAAALVPRDRA